MAFKGDNGKYLSRAGDNKIQVIKNEPDTYTKFLASEIDGKLVLKADNGKYLQPVISDADGVVYIEAAKDTPDWYTQFIVHKQTDGTVALQAANGKYMCRVGDKSYYEAVKDGIDMSCLLKPQFQV